MSPYIGAWNGERGSSVDEKGDILLLSSHSLSWVVWPWRSLHVQEWIPGDGRERWFCHGEAGRGLGKISCCIWQATAVGGSHPVKQEYLLPCHLIYFLIFWSFCLVPLRFHFISAPNHFTYCNGVIWFNKWQYKFTTLSCPHDSFLKNRYFHLFIYSSWTLESLTSSLPKISKSFRDWN